MSLCIHSYGCRPGEETRRDVCSAEAPQKAGQITAGNLCIHVSTLWLCGLRETERKRESKCKIGNAVLEAAPDYGPSLCHANLPIVIHLFLAPGSGFSFTRPTWASGGTQFSLHRHGLLIAVSEAILYHPLIGLEEVLFTLSWAVWTANRWHLNYGWCTPAGRELPALLMATLQMAFHSWLMNTIKTQLVHMRWRPLALFWPDTVSSKKV